MPRKKLIEEELRDDHRIILNLMEENESLSPMEIAERFVRKYPQHNQIVKWHASVGDVCRYVVVRYIAFLKNRGYIEPDPASPNRWRKVRESPLLKEVAEAYRFLGKANSIEEAILKLAQEYISKLKPYFENLVKQVGEAKKSIEKEKQLRQKALSHASQTLTQISQISFHESKS
ncbi:MAG: hypothetical protein QXX59_08685 [Candidatus Bathyarchaeia archaeon]